MNFQESIKLCFQKYADFEGRAKKPEFWWFFLFCLIVALLLEAVSGYISWAFSLATFIPSIAVGARRLHDTNKSGWFQLLWFVPILGWIVMVYLLAQDGDNNDNRFGPPSSDMTAVQT